MAGCSQCPEMNPGLGATWSETFQNMLSTWSTAGQQILLNLNQPKVMETTPQGTTVYATPGGTVLPTGTRTTSSPPTPVESVVGQGFSTFVIIAGIIVLALILKNREED